MPIGLKRLAVPSHGSPDPHFPRRRIGAPRLATLALAAVLSLSIWGHTRADAQPADQPGGAPPPLFTDCRGAKTTAPTVILEAGAFGTSADWDFVLDDLSADGRACAYDRSGLGLSPPGAGDVSVLGRAEEMRRLLDQLGETGPVILVGHSNGALYAEAFARMWPRRVAGLVYVNGVTSEAAEDPRLLADLRAERRHSDLALTAGQLGLGSLVAQTLTRQMRLEGDAAARKRRSLTCEPCLRVARDEDRAIIAGLDQVRALPQVPADTPIVVVEGAPDTDAPLAQAWRAAEVAAAANARTSWILDMPGATHVSPLTRDRAYVKAAVDWLRAPYQTPVLGIDAHGSAGASDPSF